MSSLPDNIEALGPAWNDFTVMVFAGALDTHKLTGEDYETRTLGSLFTMEPGASVKEKSLACIPSSYADYDGRNHKVQQERGSYVALTADIDKGDHALSRIEGLVRGFCNDAAFLVYSSAHARNGDRRWRILIPLARPVAFLKWADAQTALFDYMEYSGVEVDRALARAGQPVYLPNVPETHAKSGEPLRDDLGDPLFYQRATSGTNAPGLALDTGPIAGWLQSVHRKRAEDDLERERIRREAELRRARQAPVEGHNIIAEFNRASSLTNLLELYGYEQSPRHPEDWRSPHQTSESYATRVIGDKWVSLSASDAGARIGSQFKGGCFGDAYDLFVHYSHGGDHKAAFRALHQERRDSEQRFQPDYIPERCDDWEIDPETGDLIADVVHDYADEDLESVETSEQPQAGPAPVLPFFWFSDAQPNLDANDFVEGLLTSSAMSVIYGPSNCGKTFFIVDLALHVAWGREWRGRAVDRGAVVYLSLEGAQGIRNRLTAFRQHHGLDGEQLPFVAMPRPVNLLNDDADVNAVIALVEHVAAATNLHVAMVIVDTLSRAMAGGNENSPEDMTAIVGNCDRIRDATGAHVCIVHHSGKDEARGARGHSSLRAATDTEIEIKRDPELTFSSVRIAKQRDLEAGEPFAFTLQSVALGTNRRGKDVTSCVVVEAEKSAILARDPDKLSPKESEALACLERCIEAGGFDLNTERDTDVTRAVTLHAWKRSLQASSVVDRDNDNNARTQMRRLRNALVNKGQIQITEGNVWLA
jgi:hypothetical protein